MKRFVKNSKRKPHKSNRASTIFLTQIAQIKTIVFSIENHKLCKPEYAHTKW